MTIAVGERIPEAMLKSPGPDGPQNLSTAEIFDGRTVVLFGVPGAFTPTCSMNHLPGFLDEETAIRAKGVDAIAVVAVNDHHVMRAWAAATGGGERLLYLADGNGTFVRALGLDVDLSVAGLGTRSRRFAMVVRNGVVAWLGVDDGPGQPDKSSAAAVLADL